MTVAASVAVAWTGRAPARRFDDATRDPIGTQERTLREIMTRNRDTEYGREHSFGSVQTLRDYAAAVPVMTWQDIQERVARVTRGAKNVLTAEDPVMFARTSGTSGTPKLIPVTPTCQGQAHSDQMRVWLYHAQRAHPSMLRGKVLSLVSPAVEGRTEAGIPFGSTSGSMYRDRPWIVRRTYAVPYELFEVEDYDAKYYTLMRLGLVSDVTFLCTANPSSIVKLCEVAEQRADDLVRDIADGTLRGDLELEPAVRSAIESGLRPDPGRARALEQSRKRHDGRLLPVDYWPNLALIGCWKGGTVQNYVKRFPEWFAADGDRPFTVRDWGYLSSEARCSVPLTDEGSGGVLSVGTNVYEFVAAEEVEKAPEDWQTWRFLGIGDLAEGQEYYIFITTTGGLYRYDINDVIAVEGLYNRTPVIEFKRKGRGFTNITGEKISETQVLEAIEAAAGEVGIKVDHFKAEADVEAARYVFKVESAEPMPEAQRQPFLESLDRKLKSLNSEYEAKRKSQRLNPPLVQIMKPGWHDQEKKAEVAAGKRQFQAKDVLLESKPEEPEAKERDGDMVVGEVGADAPRADRRDARS